MVLEEYRRTGLAKRVTLNSLERMLRDHPIRALFCWPFTPGGDALAEVVAQGSGLPLCSRARR